MHIVFFNRSFYPDISATGQLLTELCEDLVRDHGCRVSVITGPPLNPPVGYEFPAGVVSREVYRGIEVHRACGTRFDKRRFAGRATNYVSYFLSACWAGLRLDRPATVVALTDPPIIGLAALVAGARFRAPLVMLFQDLFPEVTALLPDFHSDTINAALQRINCFLCRRAARIIALGQTMERRLIDNKGADPDKITVIANWADTTAIAPGPKRNSFSEAHGLADSFVVMHSGNIGLSQNLETIVEAAALLRDVPDLTVVFQGEGVKKAELEQRARALELTNVRFLPYAEKRVLTDAFAAADCFVVSLQRGLAGYIVPSKLYGILAAGRPYVAAVEPDCEVTTLTRQHECGLTAEPGNARDLADRILELYRDRELARRLGQNARTAGLSFDRRTQVARYAELFRRLAAPAPISCAVSGVRRAEQP
jgi:putative colanic acid biosynthesis glycosyltransferase WcaI